MLWFKTMAIQEIIWGQNQTKISFCLEAIQASSTLNSHVILTVSHVILRMSDVIIQGD